MIHNGACHCGDISVAFETVNAQTLPLRACQCAFCRRHHAKTTSDAAGRLVIDLAAPIEFYKFGSYTADVIVCPRCGCYIASAIAGPAGRVATLNVVGAHMEALVERAAEPISYDDEMPDAKRIRRLAKWTPTEIRIGARVS